MVHVNQALGRFTLPVRSPFLEILAGELLKDHAAKNVISRWLIEIIRRAHVILRIAMLQSQIELQRFAIALNMEGNNVAGIRVRCQQIGKLDLAIERIHVIAVLINVMIANRRHDVADLESGSHGRRASLYVGYVNPALPFFPGELTQRWIARRET